MDVGHDVTWKQIGGSANGPGIWFIAVAKMQAQSPWRIGAIGSGP